MNNLEYKILKKFHRPKKVNIIDAERYVDEFPCLLKKEIVFRWGDQTYFRIIKLTEKGYGLYVEERRERNPIRKFLHDMI